MNRTTIWSGAGAFALAVAAVAQAQWPSGWGYGNGSFGGFGRTEGPVTVDLWQNGDGMTVSVSVSGCGGVRDFRAFGTDIAGGDGQTADAAAAVTRLLGEARQVCGFEPRLATRIEDGFTAAFDAWLVEMASMDLNMTDVNMTVVDMNAYECDPESCNGM